jgi:hypothetical protein
LMFKLIWMMCVSISFVHQDLEDNR